MKKQKQNYSETKGNPISVRLPDEQLKRLKKMSHYLSLERDEDLNYVDLIVEAIDQVYPAEVNSGNKDNKDNKA